MDRKATEQAQVAVEAARLVDDYRRRAEALIKRVPSMRAVLAAPLDTKKRPA